MNTKNSVLFLFISLCVVQGTGGTFFLISSAVNGFNAAVNSSVNTVLNDFAALQNIALNVASDITSNIIQAETSAVQNVASAVLRATQLGANISNCIDIANSRIRDTITTAQSGVQNCFSIATASVLPSLAQLSNVVQQAQNVSRRAITSFNNCGLFRPLCTTNALVSFKAQAAVLTARTAADAALVVPQMASAKIAFNTCAFRVQAAAAANVTAIFAQEAQCIGQITLAS